MSMVGLAAIKGIAFIGWLGIAIYAPCVFFCIRFAYRAFFHRQPVVTFAADGVTDTRHKQSFIPWFDIGHISLGWGNGAYHYLRFQFRTRELANQYARPNFLLSFLWTRANRLADYNIYLLSLGCSRREVLRAAQRFHASAVTEMVKKMNRGGGRDLYVVDTRE
jgi:hypothetical protein